MLGMDALWHQRTVWWQTPPRADTAGFGWEPHWHSPRLTHGPSTAPTNRSFSPLGFASPGSKHRQRRTQPTPLPPLHLQPPFLSAPAPERYTNSFRLVFHPKSNFTQLREAKQGPQLPLRNNDASLKPALTHQLLQSQSSSQQSEVALAPDTSQGCSRTDAARSAAPQQELPEERPLPSPGHGLRPPDANRAPVRSLPPARPAPLLTAPCRCRLMVPGGAAVQISRPPQRPQRSRHSGPAPRRPCEAAGSARRLLAARYPAALAKSQK